MDDDDHYAPVSLSSTTCLEMNTYDPSDDFGTDSLDCARSSTDYSTTTCSEICAESQNRLQMEVFVSLSAVANYDNAFSSRSCLC